MSSRKDSSSKVRSKVGSPSIRKKRKQAEDMSHYPKLDVCLNKKLALEESKEVKNQREKSPTVLQTSSVVNGVDKRRKLNKGDSKVESTCAKANSTSKSKKRKRRKAKLNSSKESPQLNLDSFVEKKKRNKKKIFTRSDSSDSCDLPIFETRRSKSIKKDDKDDMFTNLTIEQILKDRKELEEYRQTLAAFKPLDESAFDLPFLKEDPESSEKPVESLNCRHVPLAQLKQIFDKNFNYLSDIMSGKVANVRHAKFHDPTRRPVTFTCEDLTYNTSMIVFNYSQVEHMMDLLTGQLDSDLNKLKYFFQVLLPELCLLVFMEVHNMDRSEAVDYLDKRPIAPDD